MGRPWLWGRGGFGRGGIDWEGGGIEGGEGRDWDWEGKGTCWERGTAKHVG